MKIYNNHNNLIKKASISLIAIIMIISTFTVTAEKINTANIKNISNECLKDVEDDFFSLDTEELKYYTGDQPDIVWGGSDTQDTWQAAIRFTPDELSSYDGWTINTVRFYHAYGQGEELVPHDGTVYVYDQGTSVSPGDILTQEAFTADVADWISIPLSAPVTIDASKDLWISVETTYDAEKTHYFGLGSSPAEPEKSQWIYHDSEGWKEIQEYDPSEPRLDSDWFIGAIAEGEIPPPELQAHANGPYISIIGNSIQFTGSATGGAPPYSDWRWDFGDGNTSTEQNPTHTYGSQGTYSVTLTVNDTEPTSHTDSTIATITAEPSEAKLEIGTTSGGLGKICTTIKNTGSDKAENVEWTISVDGGLLGRINVTAEGDEEELDEGEAISVCTARSIRGLGKIQISISAEADNAAKVTQNAEGFVFLFYVLGIAVSK